jgi:hypothetical protein
MLSWIIQITIISIILIFLVHHLIEFFKSTLTVPKIKDLVNSPAKKYDDIYGIIQNNSKKHLLKQNTNEHNYTLVDLLPNENLNEDSTEDFMKNELKTFLKKQLHSTSNSNRNISTLELNKNNISYSSY